MAEVQHRPPTAKVRRAIAALLAGEAKTQRDAAKIAGIHETSFCTALKRQTTKDFILSAIKDRFSTIAAIASSRVALALIETADSEYDRADMTKFALGVAGVSPDHDRKTTNVGSVNLTILMGNDKLQVTSQPIDITPSPDLPIPLPEAEG